LNALIAIFSDAKLSGIFVIGLSSIVRVFGDAYMVPVERFPPDVAAGTRVGLRNSMV
jgi:hypothetical protein